MVRWSARITARGYQVGLEMPPKAARIVGPPRTRTRRMDQSRKAHRSARPLHSPEGATLRLLKVVADYTRLSAVQDAGRARHERA